MSSLPHAGFSRLATSPSPSSSTSTGSVNGGGSTPSSSGTPPTPSPVPTKPLVLVDCLVVSITVKLPLVGVISLAGVASETELEAHLRVHLANALDVDLSRLTAVTFYESHSAVLDVDVSRTSGRRRELGTAVGEVVTVISFQILDAAPPAPSLTATTARLVTLLADPSSLLRTGVVGNVFAPARIASTSTDEVQKDRAQVTGFGALPYVPPFLRAGWYAYVGQKQ